MSTLRLDIGYVRLKGASGGVTIEVAHSDRGLITADRAHDVGNALAPWLTTAGFDSPSSIPHPLGSGMVWLVIIPIGYDGGRGVVAVASQRADFPTELDHLLLNVGVNQAAIALQEAQLLADLRATNQLKDRLLAREQAARSEAAQAAQIAQPQHDDHDAT